MAILRLTLIRLQETPKFLVSNNRDQEAVEILQRIAQKHNRICSLTIEDLESLGKVEINDDYRKHIDIKGTFRLVTHHVQILFSNRTMARSSVLVFVSWLLLEFLIHYIRHSYRYIWPQEVQIFLHQTFTECTVTT